MFRVPDQVGYLSWFRIQSILAQGLPAGVLQLGCSLEALAAQPGHEGVGLTFSDGRSVQASVAVGADGYQSKTRALLLGDGPPSYTGSAVRPAFPFSPAPALFPPPYKSLRPTLAFAGLSAPPPRSPSILSRVCLSGVV